MASYMREYRAKRGAELNAMARVRYAKRRDNPKPRRSRASREQRAEYTRRWRERNAERVRSYDIGRFQPSREQKRECERKRRAKYGDDINQRRRELYPRRQRSRLLRAWTSATLSTPTIRRLPPCQELIQQ